MHFKRLINKRCRFWGWSMIALFGMVIYMSNFSNNFTRFSPTISKVRKKDLLDRMKLNCQEVISSETDPDKVLQYRMWRYDYNKWYKLLLKSRNRCSTIRTLFNFDENPLSSEESEFPLAYGIIVYKNFMQLLFMLSAIYAPQNEYCIAVSGSSDKPFKVLTDELGNCFKNVHILNRPPIYWGGFEIINSTYACLNLLSNLTAPWQYFQYLTGTDAPLKTNYEMVQIFKAMKGAWNFEIAKFASGRLHKNVKNKTSPLPLYKSSVSALIPRAAADRIVSSPETQELLEYLKHSNIPDESFWASLGANRNLFPVPGSSIDGQKWMKFKNDWMKTINESNETAIQCYRENIQPMHYYISRYQLWYHGCKGKYSSGSCVFGVQDVPRLISASHLVAHKFYTDFEPAGYFCILKEIRRRSYEKVDFDASAYETLPQVELSKNIPYEDLTFPDCIF